MNNKITEFIDDCMYFLMDKSNLKITSFVAFFVLFFGWTACSALSTSLKSAPVIIKTIETISELVRERTGKELEEIPHSCEYEWTEERHLLLLCDFDLNRKSE